MRKYNQGVADANKRRAKHNQASGNRTKVYNAWLTMTQRCNNPNHKAYHRYGGRGITVSSAWEDFSVFYKDVGEPPTPAHTLDRIDNSKGYEAGNVRWSTRQEQANNRDTNVVVEYNGMSMTWAEWARHLNIPYDLLMARVSKKKPIEEILKPRQNTERGTLVEYNGERHTLREWAAISGVGYQTLWWRHKHGEKLF